MGQPPSKILTQSLDDLKKQALQVSCEVDTDAFGTRRCYLDFSSVESKIDRNTFWLCFDVHRLELKKQIYIGTYFCSNRAPNEVQLWVDDECDIEDFYSPRGWTGLKGSVGGSDYVEYYFNPKNSEIPEKYPRCNIIVRKLEFFMGMHIGFFSGRKAVAENNLARKSATMLGSHYYPLLSEMLMLFSLRDLNFPV